MGGQTQRNMNSLRVSQAWVPPSQAFPTLFALSKNKNDLLATLLPLIPWQP